MNPTPSAARWQPRSGPVPWPAPPYGGVQGQPPPGGHPGAAQPGPTGRQPTNPALLRPDEPAPSIAVRLVTSLWRLGIGVLGLLAPLTIVGDSDWAALFYLSQASCLLAGAYFVVLAVVAWIPRSRIDEPSPILRMWVVALCSITGIVFYTFLGGHGTDFTNLTEHLLVPLVVFLDWCLFGRNQESVRWWHPLAMLLLPLIYLAIALWRGAEQGQPLYPFLRVEAPAFVPFIAGALVGLLVLGYLLLAIGRAHQVIRTSVVRGQGGAVAPQTPPRWS